ncbi:MAG TPA: RsmD family RNA methyltransferase [Polyangiaceae bacterium]|nr:RsmD family RNA methyltransferase [Polyangiaceae bacterium]
MASRDPLLVEKLVPGGSGFLRRPGGEPLLVPGALPGDRVLVGREQRKAGVARALDWELVTPSPDRVEPVCEVYSECGGCDLMALGSEAQARAKLGLFQDALERIGHLDADRLPKSLTRAGPELGYRNRLRLQITANGHVGFFRKQSHELVEPRRCHVAAPEIDQALATLRKLARGTAGALASFAFVEIRHSEAGITFYFSLREGVQWVPVEAEALLRKLRRDHGVATSVDNDAPLERFQLSEGVFSYAAPGAFSQVNWAVNRVLVARVVDLALRVEAREFIDLYCGSGNFSLPLMAAGVPGIGVESNRAAVAAASRAAREQGLSGRFVVEDAIRYASAREREAKRFDLVLVDPPRAGVKTGLATLARISGRAIALVGCDPGTFARDLRGFMDAGFALRHLEGFDMFPQTHHLEALAWLERAE